MVVSKSGIQVRPHERRGLRDDERVAKSSQLTNPIGEAICERGNGDDYSSTFDKIQVEPTLIFVTKGSPYFLYRVR